MLAFELINVLLGVRLIVLTEGLIVIADGSGAEVLTTGSPFVSLFVELLFTTVILLVGTGLAVIVVSGVTLADGLGDTIVAVIDDLVGVTGLLLTFAVAVLVVVDDVFEAVDVVLILALLRSLFAKRLLMSVEVLVVATERVVDD